jgi:hypothetical protein
VDWNKYNDCVIATGSVDKTARLWVRARVLRARGWRSNGGAGRLTNNLYPGCRTRRATRAQDVRNPSAPLMTLAGHSYAVRRVKWSPFAEHVLYTCRRAPTTYATHTCTRVVPAAASVIGFGAVRLSVALTGTRVCAIG